MERYAFIGTRRIVEVPREALRAYDEALEWAVAQKGVIRTGAAKGADQRAAERAAVRRARVELVLPWVGYERNWVDDLCGRYPRTVSTETFDADRSEEHKAWLGTVDQYHPIGPLLRFPTRRLHARNAGIVLPCRVVIAIPMLPDLGGTGQGIRVAKGLNIPVFNLSTEKGRKEFNTWRT